MRSCKSYKQNYLRDRLKYVEESGKREKFKI